jgi:large subunit ribosomal protein L10
VKALASLPSREVLLAQLAGAFQAPLVKTAGLLQALPRNFAYGLSALIDQKAAAEAA